MATAARGEAGEAAHAGNAFAMGSPAPRYLPRTPARIAGAVGLRVAGNWLHTRARSDRRAPWARCAAK